MQQKRGHMISLSLQGTVGLERSLWVIEFNSLRSHCDGIDIRLRWILRVSAPPPKSHTIKQSLRPCNSCKTISTKGKKPQKLHHGITLERTEEMHSTAIS